MDCSDAVQKVLKGEKPAEKEKRKRLFLFIYLCRSVFNRWHRPAVAEHTRSRPPDKSKQHTSSGKVAEKKEKQPAGGGSSTNVTGGTHDDQKVDTVRSRPKAADKDGRKDPLVNTLCTCI